jgi:molybdate transport system substrate-binding protein
MIRIAKTTVLLVVFALVALPVLYGCGEGEKKEKKTSVESTSEKTLVIYCGITMRFPMQEIAKKIEKQENCKVVVHTGGSNQLLKTIKRTRKGDLYLPGSDSYIKTCIREGLVKANDTVDVGFNRAVLMVQKGNPKGITPDLKNLADKRYRVVLGSFRKGSIGRQTAKILQSSGIMNDVVPNTIKFMDQSAMLVNALKNNEADLTLNWKAVASFPGNRDYLEVLSLPESVSHPKKLVLGLLIFSEQPELARKFMAYAASKEGQILFRDYGL